MPAYDDHEPWMRPAPLGTPDQPDDLVEVRAWARSRGYPIDESADVPLQVLRTYRRVHVG